MGMNSLGKKAIRRGSLWLTAIRDAFVVLMPLTFLGLVALLLQHFPWSAYRDAMTFLWGDNWPQHLERVIKASHGIFGMVLASVVANLLAKRLMRPSFETPEIPSMIVAISALINFMLMLSVRPLFADGLGSGGMLHGIVVGIVTAELLLLAFQSRWLRLRDAPYDADSIYHHAMRLTPAVIAAGGDFSCSWSCWGLFLRYPLMCCRPW
jgi:cellobiose-specific phosphotransferase system component IIC